MFFGFKLFCQFIADALGDDAIRQEFLQSLPGTDLDGLFQEVLLNGLKEFRMLLFLGI